MKVLAVLCLCFGLISALHLDETFIRLTKKKLKMRTSGRIVGGVETEIEKHPWQLALYDAGYFFCGGVIVSKRWAVTAGHCLEDYPPISDVSFRAGSANRGSGGQVLRVMSYEVHPEYDTYFLSNDITAVMLFEEVSFDETIAAIPLAPLDFVAEHGSDVTVSGWGYLASGQLPTMLNEVTVPVVGRDACEQTWPGWLDDTMVCAGTMGRDSCNGDSGGPLTQDGTLVGLVSWGASACGNGYPGVYTRISAPSVWNFVNEKING